MVHIHDIAGDNKGVQYKMGKEWVDFRKIFTREAVLDDSLFLRFMRTSITRNSNDFSKDFIVMKFSYDAEYRLEDGEEQKMSKEELRTFYYKNGVTFQSAHTGKHGKTEPIHYKMLYRTSGKAKKGECIFVRDNLFHKAINYLTMGFYDLMEEKAKADPDTVFKLVELSAYLSLTTACAIGYIHIPLKNILVVEDQSAYTKPMAAEIVKVANVPYENDEFVLEFNDPRMETILNNHQCTLDKDKAAEKGWSYIKERTKEELKKNGIRINGTETYSNEKNKFEDFGIDSTMNNVEIMDEIIQNWNAYEEEEKKNLSSLVRSQMDDDTIMEFMNKVSNLITETEHLNHKIRRMELASCCLIGEPAGVLTFNHSTKEDED